MKTRRLAFLFLLAALAVLITPTGASGQAPSRIGWWDKLNQGQGAFGIPILKPDKAPADGLYVAQDPFDQPRAISALEFIVRVGGDATMTLKAGPGTTFSALTPIAACPATAAWSQAVQGRWDQRPQYDCNLGKVDGKPSTDGKTMTWNLTPKIMSNPTTYSVVLVPTGFVPFDTGAERPGDDALSAPQPPAASAPVPEPYFAPVAPFISGPVFSEFVPPAAEPPPVVAAPEVRAAPRAAALDDSPQPMDRVIAVGALGAVALALFLASIRRPAAVLAGADGSRIGGIGRFARPRNAPPIRL